MAITYSSGVITVTGAYDTGTATGGSTTTLVDTSKSWATNSLVGRSVWNKTTKESRRITGNTSTTITINTLYPWTAPTSGDAYSIAYNESDIQAANNSGGWGVCTGISGITGIDINAMLYLNTGGYVSPSLTSTWSVRGNSSSGGNGTAIRVKNGCRFHMGQLLPDAAGELRGTQGGSLYLADAAPYHWAYTTLGTDVGDFLIQGVCLDGIYTRNGVSGYVYLYNETAGTKADITEIIDVISTGVVAATLNNNGNSGSYCTYKRVSGMRNTLAAITGRGTATTVKGIVSPDVSPYLTYFSLDNVSTVENALVLDDYYFNNTYLMRIDSWSPVLVQGRTHIFKNARAGTSIDAGITVTSNVLYTGSPVISMRTSWMPYPTSSDTFVSGCGYCVFNALSTLVGSGTADGTIETDYEFYRHTPNIGNTTYSKTTYGPFTIDVRKYGYKFQRITRDLKYSAPFGDDSNVVRHGERLPLVVNAFVVASDAVATAYTGVTINGSAKTITLSGLRTVQEMYDYSQAWCDDAGNVQYDECLTTADGSTFSLADGWKLLTSGSYLDYGVKRLAGGTLKLTATGTYAPVVGTTTIEFAAAGTYLLTDIDATGMVTFTNTSGGSVTVELPAGVTYVNSGPSITVNEPQTYQTVTVSGATAGSRLQIYDITSATELYNGIPTFPYTWTDSVAVAADREIRVRIHYVNGASAKEFIEQIIGTCGQTPSTKDVTYLASQADDAVYNARGTDGSTITGVTFTDSTTDKMNIDISAGSVELADLYAAWVYYAFTEAGIRTDIDYIFAKDISNFIYSNLKWKNTTSPSVPLKITGGYAWDSVTEDPIDLVDTTGGTIFLAPPHVVSKTITLSGESVVTGTAAEIIAAIPSTTANAAAVLAAAQVTPIHSDMRKTVGTTLKGDGTEADKFRSVLVD